MCWGKNVANGRLESPGGHDYYDGGDNNDDDGDGGGVGDDDNDDCQGVEGNLGAGTPVAGTEGNSFKKQKAKNLLMRGEYSFFVFFFDEYVAEKLPDFLV